MEAGGSAREAADRMAEVEAAHLRKAQAAARMSANFRAGAEGEVALVQSLAPLVDKGWFVFPDLRNPRGGNLDVVVAGPAGVGVVDSKNWAFPVAVRAERIYTGKYSRTGKLDAVQRQVELVEDVLAHLSFPVVVQGFLTLVGQHDRGREPETVRDVWVVGLEHLAPGIAGSRRQLSDGQVDDVVAALRAAFSPALNGAGAARSPS